MKKLIIVLSLLFVCPLVYVASGGDTGLGTDPFTATGEFLHTDGNAMNNAVNDNDSRLDTVEALTGPVFSDGDGTYTDMSAISSTELGLLDGLTGPIYESGDEDTIVAAISAGALPADSVLPADLDQDGNYTLTGVLDFGGATRVEIPNGTDTNVVTAGSVFYDTDGANVTGDEIYRAADGASQWPVGTKLQTIQLPFTTAGAVTNWQPWFNLTGMTFTITNVYFRSDTDDLAIEIDECTSIHNLTILNTIHQSGVGGTVSTDGTSVYYLDVAAGSLDSTTIETTHGLSFDFGGAAEGLIIIEGWFNADVD